MKKKIGENACCARCRFREEQNGEFFGCAKKGRVRASEICKKYEFDPFAPRVKRQREFDTSMLDPLDFEI
ncbi:MAG: hypothetical protein LUG52_08500 [Clostridia bacterium]|nr:hypothetical protein [Clostridia bacterium]